MAEGHRALCRRAAYGRPGFELLGGADASRRALLFVWFGVSGVWESAAWGAGALRRALLFVRLGVSGRFDQAAKGRVDISYTGTWSWSNGLRRKRGF